MKDEPHRGSLLQGEALLEEGEGRKAKTRTLDALFEAPARALEALSASDARGYFEHCGYYVEP